MRAADAVRDIDHDRDLRVLARRVRYEPRIVFKVDVGNRTGPRLPRDLVFILPSVKNRRSRVCLLCHHLGHTFLDGVEIRIARLDLIEYDRLLLLDHIAVVVDDAVHDMRFIYIPAVCNRRNIPRDRDRRYCRRARADTGNDRLALVPPQLGKISVDVVVPADIP